jgi:nucleotide-binding universal stress UspA family protein
MISKRILLAFDGSEQSRRALDVAVELAVAAKAEIGIVSVVPVHAGRIGVDPWDDRPVHAGELGEARDIIMQSGIEAALHEPFGDVPAEIVRTATENGYDHIVIGHRHLNLVERLLQGSVSGAVAARATQVVTIVP